MDWQQSRFAYRLDLYLAPLLIVLASYLAEGSIAVQLTELGFGFVLWTFIEYWTHRLLFHRFMRRAHDLHHERPGGYDAAPLWMTTPIHVALSALAYSTGLLAAFAGMELGYLLYIWTHDKIHHGSTARLTTWLYTRWRHHLIHHQGTEVNFGVAVFWWDRLFGTYLDPRRGARKGT